MVRSGKKTVSTDGEVERTGKAGKRATRHGLPAESSIVSEKTLISPRNKRYRIITTTERDPYDEPDPVAKKKRQ